MAITHKPLLEYLPPFLAEYREYRRLFGALQYEISEKDKSILERIDDALKNTFIEEANEEGIKHWEKILDIVPPVGATLEERRRIVAATWIGIMPINRDGVIEIAETYSGHDADAFWVDTAVLRIELDNTNANPISLGPMTRILRQRLPANIAFNLQVSSEVHINVAPKPKPWLVKFELTGTLPRQEYGLGKTGDGLINRVEAHGWRIEFRLCGDEALDA